MNKRTLYNRNDLGQSFALAVAVMLAGQFVLGLAFSGVSDDAGNMQNWAFWLMQALYTLVIGSSAFAYAALTKTAVFQATAANKPPRLLHVGWGCLATLFLIAFMLPVNEFFMRLLVLAGLPEQSVNLPMQIVPMIAIACALAAVTEEILFRGTVARTLAGEKNKAAALAISGALFAVFHMNPAQTVHQFVLGAFLTLLALRSGSVWTTVLVHFFNNLVAVILTFTLGDSTVFVNYWYVFIPVGLTGFVACVFGYFKTTDNCWTQTESETPVTNTSRLYLAGGIVVCAALWICQLLGWI